MRVLCSRGRYLEGAGDAPLREEHHGVSVRRVRATSFGKKSHVGRVVDYLTFHLLAGLRVACSGWADVVVTLTTPPLVAWCGAAAKALRGVRHVNFVMDLHPDAEFELGMLRRESLAGRLFERLHAATLRSADCTVVLGRWQGARVLARGVAPERVREIPIWADGASIEPLEHAGNPLRERLGWSSRFVVMYSGNAGIVHTFDAILGAARELERSAPEVLFAFVGGGPRTREIEAFVREHELANVEFLPYFAREELGRSLSAADVHVLSLRPEHVGVAVPGKLYGILAAGRPALFIGSPRCESAETIVAAGAGAVFDPADSDALAREIRRLQRDARACRELGARGRAHFLRHHERSVCVEAWRELLEGVARGDAPAELGTVARILGDVETIPAALPRRGASATPTSKGN